MASGALGGTLRQLRDLFGDGTAVGLGDGQLLARYAHARDEAAFAAIVARHGPMVLATCRAVLRHEPDAEDAFQATFLVLAKKARSVRAGDALGGWLHRVAYRASVRAGIAARRRRRGEAEAAAMAILEIEHTGPDPDVAPIVHEELDRLPDRHRLPVVLCDLEGLTYEQAAARLRWSEPTLRHRLVKARGRLRERLARRGITAGAVGTALAASTDAARAAVPAALARAAVAAAAGGSAPATVAALSADIVRGLLAARLRIAAASLLAAVALATAGTLAAGSRRPDPPASAIPPQAGAAMKRPPAAGGAAPPASDEEIEVRGRVVDPGGRPVAGASVLAYQPARDNGPVCQTDSGPDGRFAIRVRLRGILALLRGPAGSYPWLVASAPGFGPGWVPAVRGPGAPEEATIRLVEEGPPIEGRIVDLEGRPVVWAQVRLRNIWIAREGTLAGWLERAAELGTEGPGRGLAPLPAATLAITGADGRFRLAGLGRDRIAEILVLDPTIATTQLYVATRDGTPIHVTNNRALAPERSRLTYYPRRFEFAALPTWPIEGTVRDKDTGRPIPRLLLEGMVYQERSLIPAAGVDAVTDEAGRYRLVGLPRAPAYRLFVGPARGGQPYPEAVFRVPAGASWPEPIRFDMTLKRGVVVRGRVTDRATGRPVPGLVAAYTFADNPHAREYPGYAESGRNYADIDNDGRYEVVALPGRGIIACVTNVGRYRRGVGAGAITRGFEPVGNSRGGFNTLPGMCMIDEYHVLAEVALDPKAKTVTRDLHVEPGRTLTIHVVDPDGRPLGGTKAWRLSDVASTFDFPQDSPEIEVYALDPSDPRRVVIAHDGRKLVGSAFLKGDEAGPLTVRLQPHATIAGRLLDEDGRPIGNVVLNSLGGFGPQATADRGTLPRDPGSLGVPVGRDGRFRVEGLIPGLKYGASARRGRMDLGTAFDDVVLAPGEVKDLGDLRVVPRKPGN
jgi:RNA polymerase sigma factor (sigma-70 family)